MASSLVVGLVWPLSHWSLTPRELTCHLRHRCMAVMVHVEPQIHLIQKLHMVALGLKRQGPHCHYQNAAQPESCFTLHGVK